MYRCKHFMEFIELVANLNVCTIYVIMHMHFKEFIEYVTALNICTHCMYMSIYCKELVEFVAYLHQIHVHVHAF